MDTMIIENPMDLRQGDEIKIGNHWYKIGRMRLGDVELFLGNSPSRAWVGINQLKGREYRPIK